MKRVAAILLSLALAGTTLAAPDEVWVIQLLEIDYVKGTVTLRIRDLEALVNSHNQKVDEIKRLKAVTGCT